MVLRKLECDQAQWEWRAREAENKANARLDAAQSSHTAAIEAANIRALNAEARSADFESQAKAACLQVLVSTTTKYSFFALPCSNSASWQFKT